MLIRPVTMKDHAALMVLAEKAGYGMTSLPQDAGVLETKIKDSELSFANKPNKEKRHSFLMVMEDDEGGGEIVGSTGIKAHVGLYSPFYSYKLSTIVQASKETDVYSNNRVLHMVNDYTGATEIGSLFLRKSFRRDGYGKCLSRCRFLMLAEFPELFANTVIAEMRGVHDETGHSPFYDNLARHFFQIPFREADYINATKGGQFIADLMPKYPIYEKLLAPEAQAVIGVVNEASKPALLMLEREGFHNGGYLDIFDGGPTVQAQRDTIRTVRHSRRVEVAEISAAPLEEDSKYILMTTKLADLRFTQARARVDDAKHSIILHEADARRLNVREGSALRIVEA